MKKRSFVYTVVALTLCLLIASTVGFSLITTSVNIQSSGVIGNGGITLVQGPETTTANIASGAFNLALSQSPVCGDVLILCYGGIDYGGGSPSISIIKQVNVIWSPATDEGSVAVWYGIVLPEAGTNITINVDNGYGSYPEVMASVFEWSGLAVSNCVDQTAYNSGGLTQTADTGTTNVTTQADELWIGGIFGLGSSAAGAAQSNSTNSFKMVGGAGNVLDNSSSGEYISFADLYKVVSSAGAADSGTTLGGCYYSGCIVTFRAGTPSLGVGSATNVYCGQLGNGTYFSDDGLYTLGSSSTIINNAISWVSSLGGGDVTLVNGTIILDGTLIPQSNVFFNATGITISQNPPAALNDSISLMLTGGQVQNFIVDGGIWNGNKGSLSDFRNTGTWNANFGIYFGIGFYGGADSGIIVENAVVENVVGQGIDLLNCANSLVQNCTTINDGDNPITLDVSSSNSIINACTDIGGQDVGINTFQASNCTIENCNVQNVTQYSGASHWGIAAENSNYVNILNNTVSLCPYNIVSTSNNVLMQGNTLNGGGSSLYGIQIQGAVNTIVNNNTITGCSAYALGTYPATQTIGAQITNNVFYEPVVIAGFDVNFVGNTFLDCSSGITDTGSPANNTYIANCNFSGVTGTPISMSASYNTTLQGNTGLSGYYVLTENCNGPGTVGWSYNNSNITTTTGNWQFPNGANVEITAYPNTGYSFDEWKINGVNQTTQSTSLEMNTNQTATAYFT